MTYVHIYAPPGRYVGQIRRYGHRRWERVCESKTANAAMIKSVQAMKHDHKRARVLFCTEWHEPHIVMELCK